MASGVSRVVRGSVMGTGSAIDIKTPGFRPRSVRLLNDTGDQLVWLDGMADAAGFKRIAAGTGSFIVADGVTPLAEGFTIGADAAINALTEVVYWEVIE